MEYTFFNIILAFSILALIITAAVRTIRPVAVITGLIYIGYSLLFDIIFGERLGLYYYISPAKSTLYIAMSAVLLYFPFTIIYITFAPSFGRRIIPYTILWTLAMLLMEYACLRTGTLVFTGWTMFPWSIITYAVSYTWVILLARYLEGRNAVRKAV